MSRNLLKTRPPASPNKPPPAPMKIPIKGSPLPINVNLLITGSTIEHQHQPQPPPEADTKPSKYSNKGIAQVTSLQAYTPCLDRHQIQSLIGPTSVDDSFYDRFERLDRESIAGDVTSCKERGGRAKSAGSSKDKNVFSRLSAAVPRASSASVRAPNSVSRVSNANSRVTSATSRVSSATSRASSATSRASSATSRASRASTAVSRPTSASKRERKRPKSAPTSRKNSKVSTGTFFDLAISLDDETRQNTITNAESRTDLKPLGIEHSTSKSRPRSARSKGRPWSGRNNRERSRSRRRSNAQDTRDNKHVNSKCIEASSHSKASDRRSSRIRNSRSRTRLDSKDAKVENVVRREKVDTVLKDTNAQRSVSVANKRRRNLKSKEEKVSLNDCLYTNVISAPFKHTPTPPKAPKTNPDYSVKAKQGNTSAIDVVSKANDANRAIKRIDGKERILYNERRRYSASSLPKLRMVMAPSALPLATLVRHSSAKMLMHNAHASSQSVMKKTVIV